MADRRKMTDGEIVATVHRKVTGSIGSDGSALSTDRAKALRYYRGERFGNEVEGRSQIVSRDVAEIVDGMLPSLLRPFVSGDETVRYEPRGPEDEQVAAQATDYANYVWNVDNPGFRVFHDWIKDGLLARVGVIKVWWETRDETTREVYSGLTEDEVQALQTDKAVEIVELEAGAPQMVQPDQSQPPQEVPTFDAVIRRTEPRGKLRVMNVPPEEFLTDGEAIDLENKPFVAHRRRVSRSDLLEMGYSKDVVDKLPSGNDGEQDSAGEKHEREQPERGTDREENADPSTEEVWVTEAYLRLDADRDGIAEYRMVTVAGGETGTVLENEEVEDHPFSAWSPYPIPHKFHGESAADKLLDVQLTKSAILRQMLDNLYLINNARTEVVEGEVNLDDFLSSKPGGYVRVKKPQSMREIVVPPVFQNAFPALEYMDSVRENRTGQTRYNQGLDAESLNKTATGINAIMGAAMGRIELIARVFAELGVRRAFRLVLRNLIQHQDKGRVVRLRNQWIEVDPRAWNAEMDVSVSVGLGSGNTDQKLQHLMALWMKQMEAAKMQGGIDGPLVGPQHFYETGKQITVAVGQKNTELFWRDPKTYQPPEPQPDPEMVKVQAQIEADKAKQVSEFELKKREQDMDFELQGREMAIKAAHGAFAPQPTMMEGA